MGSFAVLVVVVLAVAIGHKMTTVNAGPHEHANGAPTPNAGGGAVPCDTTKSAAKQEICGTSTDSARWWNAAGIGTFMGAGSASWEIVKPIFFPPDSAYTHYAIPKGDEKYAEQNGERSDKQKPNH